MDYHLNRFVAAQNAVYPQVLAELRSGKKTGHWMWYVFPQIRGLGRSETARFYAISSLDEARSYLEHPILGARLRECVELVSQIPQQSLLDIFGPIDSLKFCSSMTLFSRAATDDRQFRLMLERFCGGQADQATLDIINEAVQD